MASGQHAPVQSIIVNIALFMKDMLIKQITNIPKQRQKWSSMYKYNRGAR